MSNNAGFITSDTEISMHQVLQIFISRWRYLVILALLFSLGAIIRHKFFPQYPAQGKVIIKNVENSQVQSFLSSFVGNLAGLSLRKGYETNTQAIVYLKTNTFFLALADEMIKLQSSKASDPQLVESFSIYFSQFKLKPTDGKFRQSLADSVRRKVRFNPEKTGQIVFKVKTNRKAFSVYLLNVAIDVAAKLLTDTEVKSYIKAETFFEEEIKDIEEKLTKLEQASIKKMKKSEVISTELEEEESSRYLDNLRQSIADVMVNIEENNKIVQSLKKKGVEDEGQSKTSISKFGASSQIKILQDENKVLKIRLETYEAHLKQNYRAYIRKVTSQKKALLSFKNEIEKLKQNYLLEYQIYKDLKDKLVRIKLQRTYTKNRIEILEKARIERVRSYPGVIMMILIAIMLSQIIGLGSIYIFELFRPIKHQKI